MWTKRKELTKIFEVDNATNWREFWGKGTKCYVTNVFRWIRENFSREISRSRSDTHQIHMKNNASWLTHVNELLTQNEVKLNYLRVLVYFLELPKENSKCVKFFQFVADERVYSIFGTIEFDILRFLKFSHNCSHLLWTMKLEQNWSGVIRIP